MPDKYANGEPVAELQPQFSGEGATATSWELACDLLDKAEVFWLSTVRPDGRPHVTTLLSVWVDGALYFCTGEGERKFKNLMENPHCILTTGCNVLEGLDVVVEGDAVNVSNAETLQRVADRYAAKYDWQYTVREGAFYGDAGRADVYEVAPKTVFGFGKGKTSSQTRWRF